jgi:hypothetical protein
MPIDLATPAAHVGDTLDRAGNTALSVADLAAGYRHSIGADLQRVQDRYHLDGPQAATRWIIDYVARNLNHVVVDGEKFRLADGKTFGDLRWNARPLKRRAPAPRLARLAEFFDPLSGNAEARNRPDAGLDELRESMRPGWDKRLGGPIVIDNRDVVLSGRRRMKIAAELKLELPKGAVVRQDFPNDDAGNLQRWRILAQSNTGRPWTQNEREKLIALLADINGVLPEGITQDNLAVALNVSQSTIDRDLKELEAQGITQPGNSLPPKDYRSKTSKRGRPRKEAETDDFEDRHPGLVTNIADEMERGGDTGLGTLQKRYGLTEREARNAQARAKGVVRGRAEGRDGVRPPEPTAESPPEPAPVEPQPEPERYINDEGDAICVCPNCGQHHRELL